MFFRHAAQRGAMKTRATRFHMLFAVRFACATSAARDNRRYAGASRYFSAASGVTAARRLRREKEGQARGAGDA